MRWAASTSLPTFLNWSFECLLLLQRKGGVPPENEFTSLGPSRVPGYKLSLDCWLSIAFQQMFFSIFAFISFFVKLFDLILSGRIELVSHSQKSIIHSHLCRLAFMNLTDLGMCV